MGEHRSEMIAPRLKLTEGEHIYDVDASAGLLWDKEIKLYLSRDNARQIIKSLCTALFPDEVAAAFVGAVKIRADEEWAADCLREISAAMNRPHTKP